MQVPPRLDLTAAARALEVDLDDALERLRLLYEHVDARNKMLTADLELPCHRGCSDCCHESVFLTPLEFFGAWRYLQEHADDQVFTRVVHDGLALYEQHKELIDRFDEPPPAGHPDHTELHKQLAFRCPLLDDDGACRVYPWREMLGRLFGCSFNDDGGVYGCHLSGEALGGKTLTLLRARPMMQLVHELPLTDSQQVWPHYVHALYAGLV
jgi:Fe-S-cluster containining protein